MLGTGELYGAGGISQYEHGWGLYGRADGEHGTGLYVNTSGPSSNGAFVINYSTVYTAGFGIYGVKGYSSGYDILADGYYPSAVVGDTGYGNGVIGVSSADYGDGVMGIITGTASNAVLGLALGTDFGNGMYGSTSANYGMGVIGYSGGANGSGVYGASYLYGIYGTTYSTNGIAVAGLQSGYSIDDLGTFWAPGGFFAGRNGLIGFTRESGGYGVAGVYDATSGNGAAVRGRSNSASAYGVYGINNGGGYAGYFSGDVYVNGDFEASGAKSFRIDYPLDPANKYLYHYAVESPLVQNQYNGTVSLDASGEATVDLPEYFSAVNTGPFTYQLTAIGAPGPNLYISQEVTGNQFKIAGGTPGMKVSWLLFGVRNDPWMRDYPHTDVVDKPEGEAGKYVYPQGYGQPASLQIGILEQSNTQNWYQPVLPSTQQNTGIPGSIQFPPQAGVPGSSTYISQP